MKAKGYNKHAQEEIQEEVNKLTDEEINKIAKLVLKLNAENVGSMIEYAQKLAKILKQGGISTSKLRDFYDYVVRIKESKTENWYLKLMLLKPRIVYNIGKEGDKRKRKALEKFFKVIDKILNEMEKNNYKHFENFLTFFEAVVAYHKFL